MIFKDLLVLQFVVLESLQLNRLIRALIAHSFDDDTGTFSDEEDPIH